jgi:hypothetical protein
VGRAGTGDDNRLDVDASGLTFVSGGPFFADHELGVAGEDNQVSSPGPRRREREESIVVD